MIKRHHSNSDPSFRDGDSVLGSDIESDAAMTSIYRRLTPSYTYTYSDRVTNVSSEAPAVHLTATGRSELRRQEISEKYDIKII